MLLLYYHRRIYSEAVLQRSSVEKVFLKISKNSQENTCASVFLNKVAGVRPVTLLKKTLAQVFPVKFAKFLTIAFFKEHLRWLLLNVDIGKLRVKYEQYYTLVSQSDVNFLRACDNS